MSVSCLSQKKFATFESLAFSLYGLGLSESSSLSYSFVRVTIELGGVALLESLEVSTVKMADVRLLWLHVLLAADLKEVSRDVCALISGLLFTK